MSGIEIDIGFLKRLIESHRFIFANESELQAAIAQVLTDAGLEFSREVSLSRNDRIDFLVGDIGIEVKVEGGLAEVTRQLHRYFQFEQIGSVLLITTRMRHAMNLPASINDKPLLTIALTNF